MNEAPPNDTIRHFTPLFHNLRTSFKMKGVDIGTHMSIFVKKNGRMVVVDAITLSPEAKAEFDTLTKDGTLVDAVLAVHPFHTLAFKSFHEAYPNLKYFGTPRHIRRNDIPWTDALKRDDPKSLTRPEWAPEIELRIPEGAEYDSPFPEEKNHFISVFVYHKTSKTMHVDDSLIYAEQPNLLMKAFGYSAGNLSYHPSMYFLGLNGLNSFTGATATNSVSLRQKDPNAPLIFSKWMDDTLNTWNDIENLATAHIGVKMGGAHEAIRSLHESTKPKLRAMSMLRGGKKNVKEDAEEVPTFNVQGAECG